jgi:hypothetical protein
MNPRRGGFTQEDPIGLAGGMNSYGFAGGDRINFSDPFGLNPVVCAVPVATPACVAGASFVITGLKAAAVAAWAGALAYAGHARAVSKTNGSLDVAEEHISAAAGPPPGGGDDPNWRNDKLKQAQKHLNNAAKYAKNALGKTAKELEQRIENAQKSLDAMKQPTSGPPDQTI